MTSNSNMPIAAIPEALFDALLQYVDPLIGPTVNHLVQAILERWLARPQVFLLREDGQDVEFRRDPIKRVRVTRSQYDMAQSVQSLLRRHGRYVPLHVVIFHAMWSAWPGVREIHPVSEGTQAEGVTRDGQLTWVHIRLFEPSDEEWYLTERDVDLPEVAVVSDLSPDKQ